MSRPTKKTSLNKDGRKRQKVILLIEDNSARLERPDKKAQSNNGRRSTVAVCLHRIAGEAPELVSQLSYKVGSKRRQPGGRASIALQLLDKATKPEQQLLIVAGSAYGSNRAFLSGISQRRLEAVAELRPSFRVEMFPERRRRDLGSRVAVSELLKEASWHALDIRLPQLGRSVQCRGTELGLFRVDDHCKARLFAVDVGAIERFHRGVIIGASTDHTRDLSNLIRDLYWVRWIRPFVRRRERSSRKPTSPSNKDKGSARRCDLTLQYRPNITLARLQDESCSLIQEGEAQKSSARGLVTGGSTVLNVVELFAGAGGMGLGFLMAGHPERRFRLVFSGELDPIYAQTLKRNYDYLAKNGAAERPADLFSESVHAINLSGRKTLELVASKVRESGGVDVLIGGPPCQGFSSANRNSWSSDNPHNRLVNVFMKYVDKLEPQMFLMENVQGIVWTAKDGRAKAQPSVADHVLNRMESSGYLVFPKLLDAVWYGVPQFRTRFFVLGIHRDAGYRPDDFGTWGPFPAPTHGPAAGVPFVTVREAIGDLPAIGNGYGEEESAYCEPATNVIEANPFLKVMRSGAPKVQILDHVTSRHADYVIERYKRIPPGGNWQDIMEMMSNYASVERTHSNIYRRLEWNEPSITIGHYRKSMLVHPHQHRGLSLREACRLQSFPDWFRLVGTEDGRPGGLMHKQQQLANAVCPLMSKAIAGFVLEL